MTAMQLIDSILKGRENAHSTAKQGAWLVSLCKRENQFAFQSNGKLCFGLDGYRITALPNGCAKIDKL